MTNKRLILAVTGASGIIYAQALADALGSMPEIELHIIMSNAAKKVLELELGLKPEAVTAKAGYSYDEKDIAAPPASGSWQSDGMIVCPCSMASLAAIAHGLGSNLIHRAADVMLKEGRKLVLVPRETPLSAIHIKNMLAAREAGAVIMPACPGFYHQPENIGDLANQLAGKILDQLGIAHELFQRWGSKED